MTVMIQSASLGELNFDSVENADPLPKKPRLQLLLSIWCLVWPIFTEQRCAQHCPYKANVGWGVGRGSKQGIESRTETKPDPIKSSQRLRKKDLLVPVLRIYGPSVLYSTFLSHISLLIKFLCTTPLQRTSNLTIGTRIDPSKVFFYAFYSLCGKGRNLIPYIHYGNFLTSNGESPISIVLKTSKPHSLPPQKILKTPIMLSLSHIGLLSLFQFPVFHLD